MLKIYDFNLYKMIDHLEIRNGKLYLFYPEKNKRSKIVSNNIKINRSSSKTFLKR
jgi:hypothetical protein